MASLLASSKKTTAVLSAAALLLSSAGPNVVEAVAQSVGAGNAARTAPAAVGPSIPMGAAEPLPDASLLSWGAGIEASRGLSLSALESRTAEAPSSFSAAGVRRAAPAARADLRKALEARGGEASAASMERAFRALVGHGTRDRRSETDPSPYPFPVTLTAGLRPQGEREQLSGPSFSAAQPHVALHSASEPPWEKPAAKAETTPKWKLAFAAATVAASVALGPQLDASIVAAGAGLVVSVALHEVAHLWALRKLGDDTALKYGKFSLNPLKRIDPLGTIALPAATLAASSLTGVPILLGWAKPVAVDFNRLRDPKRHSAAAAIVGPLMNGALAVAAGAAALGLPAIGLLAAGGGAQAALATIAGMNAMLAIFNLLPLPHFDGGKLIVAVMPEKAYRRWTRNPALPDHAQGIFRRIYEGPANLLTRLHLDHEARGNVVPRLITLALLAGAYAAFYSVLPTPLVFMMLPCSYFYYCIREKMQSQEAVDELVDILDDLGADLSALADGDGGIKSEIDPKIVRTVAGNTLEDAIDAVIGSDGFDGLTNDEKWARLEALYRDRLVDALHREGMSADDPETIRRVLEGDAGRKYFSRLRGWVDKYEVFERWERHKKQAPKKREDDKELEQGGTPLLSILVPLAVAGLGSALGLDPAATGGAMLALGAVSFGEEREGPPRSRAPPEKFAEALARPEHGINQKDRDFLLSLLTEMKLVDKPPVSGRADETRRLVKAITAPRRIGSSVTLVGEAGVGKTAVVEKLAQLLKLADGRPEDSPVDLRSMRGRHLVELDVNELLMQKDAVGALAHLLALIQKLNDPDPRTGNRVLLFVDEIHMLFQSQEAERFANLLKKPLRDGSVTLVAATTPDEYKKHIETDRALRRRLPPLWVGEPTVQETLRMVQGARAYYEHLLGVKFSDDALTAAVENSKYDTENHLPDKAFAYLRAAARSRNGDVRLDDLGVRIQSALDELGYVAGVAADRTRGEAGEGDSRLKDETPIDLYNMLVRLAERAASLYAERDALLAGKPMPVIAEHVNAEISEATGVKAGQLTQGKQTAERALSLEADLKKWVLGQDEAVGAISDAVRRNAAGISDPNRPLGVFFMTGTTGVGKTHLAKSLARELFNDPDAVVRVDMTEYMESHTVSTLIGSPKGYVGYGEGGVLTEAVRRRPYSVVLFDEIEKAHPDVFDLLLQIMGEGRLTDRQGRTVDFKNTVIMMTSNLGMGRLDLAPYKKAYEALRAEARNARAQGLWDDTVSASFDDRKRELAERMRREIRQAALAETEKSMKRAFKPEFRNRFDEVLVFNPITPDVALGITRQNLAELGRVLEKAGHKLEFDDASVAYLAEAGYDVELGARPIHGAIRREVSSRLAARILESMQKDGASRALVRLAGSAAGIELAVEPRPQENPAKEEPAEGAGRRLFESVFSRVLKAVADGASPELGFDALDALARSALAPAAPAPVEAEGEAPPEPQPEPDLAPPAEAGPTLFSESPAPVLAAGEEVEAEGPDAATRDEALRAANRRIDQELARAGYPEVSREAVTRWRARPSADPAGHIGFVKLFTAHAKRFAPRGSAARARLKWSIGADGAVLVVRRPGPTSPAEIDQLREHFGGAPTASRRESVDRSMRRNMERQRAGRAEDGDDLMHELRRALVPIPGATLGFHSSEAATEYWIRLPPVSRPDEQGEAPARAKLVAANYLEESSMRVVFEPGVDLTRAVEFVQTFDLVTGPFVDSRDGHVVSARADGPTETAEKALRISAGGMVRRVEVHPSILERLRPSASSGIVLAEASEAPGFIQPAVNGVDESRRGLEDRSLQATVQQLVAQMASDGYSRDPRRAAGVFLEVAADWLKEASRAHQDSEAGEHMSLRTQWESGSASVRVALHRSRPGMTDGEAESLRTLVDSSERLQEALAAAGVGRVFRGTGSTAIDGEGATVWIDIPRALPAPRAPAAPGAESEASARTQSPVQGATDSARVPAPVLQPARPDESVPREKVAKFLVRLIRQGGSRGGTLRLQAALALAEIAGPDQLELARDWIRMDAAGTHADKLAAASLLLAEHGSREDLERVIEASRRLNAQWGHDFNPAKDLVAEALARMLAPRTVEGLRSLREAYRAEKDRSSKNEVLVEAQFRALARAGSAVDAARLLEDADETRMAELVAFMRRAAPERLDDHLQRWRSEILSDSKLIHLALLHAAETGGEADLPRIEARLLQRVAELKTAELAARAFARLVQRLGAWDRVADQVRRWLQGDLSDDSTFGFTFAGVMTAGLAGDAQTLGPLEAMMRVNPSDFRSVHNYHEETQHEAAVAWAQAAVRNGAARDFLRQGRDARGVPAPSRFESMMRDRNPLINLAAVETLRLLFRREPRAGPPPPAEPVEPAPRRVERERGAAEADPSSRGPGSEFHYQPDHRPPKAAVQSTRFEPLERAQDQEGSRLSRLGPEERELYRQFVGPVREALDRAIRRVKPDASSGPDFTVEFVRHERLVVVFTLRPNVTLSADERELVASELRGVFGEAGSDPSDSPLSSLLSRLARRGWSAFGFTARGPNPMSNEDASELLVWLAVSVPLNSEPPLGLQDP